MSKPTTPHGRLEALVDYVHANPDPSKLDAVWRAYLGRLADDAPALASDHRVETLLAMLREAGHGWPTRAATVAKVIRQAAANKPVRSANAPTVERDDGRTADVLSALEVDRRGNPRKTLRNIVTILERDPRWRDSVRLNGFTGEVEVDAAPLRDEVTTGVALRLDQDYGIDVATQKVDEAIRYVALESSYHPVRDYLSSLSWDGRPRVRSLLEEYLGASPASLDQEVLFGALSMRFLVGAVARVMRPGCKLDTVLVLQGKQGVGKSTALSVLGGEWYADTELDPHGKDALQQIQGIWIYEVSELERWNNRRDAATIKAFLTSRTDRYRPPYGRNVIQQPRQVAFAATTNRKQVLADATGSRRFWPVDVGVAQPIDVTGLRADRDQLWAEALTLYQRGERWYLDADEAEALAVHSEDAHEHDPWEDRIALWLASNPDKTLGGFTMATLLDAIGVPADRQNAGTAVRAGDLLRKHGLTSTRQRQSDGSKRAVWRSA